MAIIKKNECYDNKYLGDFKISLEAKGFLTILLMGKPEFDGDNFELSKYNLDTPEHINEVLKELIDNNYLSIVDKRYKNKIKYTYIVYHNRWKMI